MHVYICACEYLCIFVYVFIYMLQVKRILDEGTKSRGLLCNTYYYLSLLLNTFLRRPASQHLYVYEYRDTRHRYKRQIQSNTKKSR